MKDFSTFFSHLFKSCGRKHALGKLRNYFLFDKKAFGFKGYLLSNIAKSISNSGRVKLLI